MSASQVLSSSLALFLLAASFTGGCAPSVNDLLVEARSGDPESIKVAVVESGEILLAKEEAGVPYDKADEEAIRYLRDVAEKGSNPLNRMQALSSLGRLKRPDLTDLFLSRLEDPFWAVRMEAARALAARPVPQAVAPLAKRLEVETRVEVRLCLVQALAGAGGEEALKALLKALLDRSGRYETMSLRVHDAVCAMSQRSFSLEDAKSWQGYYDERFADRATTQAQVVPPAATPPAKEVGSP